MNIRIRVADSGDIDQIQHLRRSVNENVLSNPEKVTDAICQDYLTRRGKGWVAESGGALVGFAIADLQEQNIWALFVAPGQEKQGIGKTLHDTMLGWYFEQAKETVWLSTEPGTRAEGFYKKQHWENLGLLPNGEVKFQMTRQAWLTRQP